MKEFKFSLVTVLGLMELTLPVPVPLEKTE
jgi:hypothetical protein